MAWSLTVIFEQKSLNFIIIIIIIIIIFIIIIIHFCYTNRKTWHYKMY